MEASDAGAEERADLVAVRLVEVEAGIFQSAMGSRNRKLREPVGAPHFFGRRQIRDGIKVGDFGGDFAIIVRRVKRGNCFNTAFASDDVVPKRVDFSAE